MGHDKRLPWIPRLSSLSSNRRWETESNAFVRSRKMQWTELCLLRPDAQSLTAESRRMTVVHLLQKPCCELLISLLDSRTRCKLMMNDPFHNFSNNRSETDKAKVGGKMFITLLVHWNNKELHQIDYLMCTGKFCKRVILTATVIIKCIWISYFYPHFTLAYWHNK